MTTDMHAERIATALERIADALERAHPVEYRRTGLGAAWDACEVADGYLDGSGAARPNGNDSMASLDALGQIMTAIETGCDMVTYSLRPQSNAQQTVDAMHAAVALLRETVMRYTGPTVTVDARSLETGEPVPVSVTVRKVADPLGEWRTGVHIAEGMTVRIIGADGSTRVGTVGEMVEADGLTNWALIPDDEPDPLDEDDHRPRHFPDGEHLYRNVCGWHTFGLRDCRDHDHGDTHTLAWWDEPLTFCDCP